MMDRQKTIQPGKMMSEGQYVRFIRPCARELKPLIAGADDQNAAVRHICVVSGAALVGEGEHFRVRESEGVQKGRDHHLSDQRELGRRSGKAAQRSANNVLETPAEETSEAARDAISEDMNLAMMKYMPLRGMISFSGGDLPDDFLDKLVDALND